MPIHMLSIIDSVADISLEMARKTCFHSRMAKQKPRRKPSPLERAKELAGGAAGLARLLGSITPQAVSLWKRVPAERVVNVERVTGVRREELRPDIFAPSRKRPKLAEARA